MLLGSAFPDMNAETLAELSIGSRDAGLLLLRQHLFGSRLVNHAVCPECSERIEWEQDIGDILLEAGELPETRQFSLKQDGYELLFRLPNSRDLSELESMVDIRPAVKHLLKNCIFSAEHDGAACEIEQLPDSVIVALNRRIEALDPQAEVRIRLTCPECSHPWEVFFDIAGFLWEEINEWSERMLLTIHKLARAYGWTEREILKLSPVRRQFYLGMVES